MRLFVILPTWMCATLVVGCVPELHSPGGADAACGTYVAAENTWPQKDVPSDMCGDGWAEGEVVDDARWTDQHGQEVSLWQFYGDVVVLDFSTLWCSPCRDLATGVQATADDYREEGLTYITILVEDMEGNVPDQAELNDWGDYYGIVEPIVSDTANVSPTLLPQSNYPGVFLLDRTMTNLGRVDPASDETIRTAIEEQI